MDELRSLIEALGKTLGYGQDDQGIFGKYVALLEEKNVKAAIGFLDQLVANWQSLDDLSKKNAPIQIETIADLLSNLETVAVKILVDNDALLAVMMRSEMSFEHAMKGLEHRSSATGECDVIRRQYAYCHAINLHRAGWSGLAEQWAAKLEEDRNEVYLYLAEYYRKERSFDLALSCVDQIIEIRGRSVSREKNALRGKIFADMGR
jgi:tetratricopeptide (TPR) repeat protein